MSGGHPCGTRFTIRFSNQTLSTIAAAIPVVTLLVLLASGKVKAHLAAVIALLAAILVTIAAFSMPAGLAIRAAILASPPASSRSGGSS